MSDTGFIGLEPSMVAVALCAPLAAHPTQTSSRTLLLHARDHLALEPGARCKSGLALPRKVGWPSRSEVALSSFQVHSAACPPASRHRDDHQQTHPPTPVAQDPLCVRT